MKKILSTALVAVVSVFALTSCDLDETAEGEESSAGVTRKDDKGADYTVAQENAIDAAEDYLALGTGFSRDGLFQQLTSKAGSGFKKADANFALDQLKIDWNKQAVMAAKGYLDVSSFSRNGLLEQLTSKAGSGFTDKQAKFAVDKVGL